MEAKEHSTCKGVVHKLKRGVATNENVLIGNTEDLTEEALHFGTLH